MSTLTFMVCGLGARAASAASMPAEGIFENCPLDAAMQTCIDRLQVMHQGGIQVVVMGAEGASLGSLATYAAAAHELGMSVMWALSDPGWWQQSMSSTGMSGYMSPFASACGCSQDGQLLSYMIRWLAVLPGTYGYYAADDSMLSAGDKSGVASYVSMIKQQDPVHTVLIGSADQTQSNTYQGIADEIGTEVYPVTTSSLLPAAGNQAAWDSVAQSAIDSQSSANRANKQSAFILQAFTWGDNRDDGQAIGVCSPTDTTASCYAQLRYPSAGEQLRLRNEILLHSHPKLILWWSFQGTYGQAGNDTYSIYPTGTTAASRWSGLTAAIQAPAPTVNPPAHRVRASNLRQDLRVTRNAMTVAGSGGSIAAPPAPSRNANGDSRPTGATISYTDTQAAQTTLAILKAVPGSMSGHGCVPAPSQPVRTAQAQRCTRFVSVGGFTHRDRAGANSFHFTGRVNGCKLTVGSYRLLAFGTLDHRRGARATTTFHIVG